MITGNALSNRVQFVWSASLKEAGLLLFVATVAACGWWLHGTDRLPLRADPAVYQLELEAPLLTIPEALAAYEEGDKLFVDTRQGAPETIPGSLFIREATFDDDLLANFDFLFPEDELILFGDGNLTAASNVAGRLRERGFAHVTILKGGLSAWQEAGGGISTAAGEAGP